MKKGVVALLAVFMLTGCSLSFEDDEFVGDVTVEESNTEQDKAEESNNSEEQVESEESELGEE